MLMLFCKIMRSARREIIIPVCQLPVRCMRWPHWRCDACVTLRDLRRLLGPVAFAMDMMGDSVCRSAMQTATTWDLWNEVHDNNGYHVLVKPVYSI
jgi:hypothetical protein